MNTHSGRPFDQFRRSGSVFILFFLVMQWCIKFDVLNACRTIYLEEIYTAGDRGNPHDCIMFYEHSLRTFSQDVSGYRDLGACYIRLKDYGKARKTYLLGLAHTPHDPDLEKALDETNRLLSLRRGAD